MTDFFIKQNDTKPDLDAVLTETPSGGAPGAINLTEAETVYFIAREKGAKDPTAPKIKAACEIVSAALGEVRYKWIAENTNASGEYLFEFEIVWKSGATETVPREGYYTLDIEDDLG